MFTYVVCDVPGEIRGNIFEEGKIDNMVSELEDGMLSSISGDFIVLSPMVSIGDKDYSVFAIKHYDYVGEEFFENAFNNFFEEQVVEKTFTVEDQVFL